MVLCAVAALHLLLTSSFRPVRKSATQEAWMVIASTPLFSVTWNYRALQQKRCGGEGIAVVLVSISSLSPRVLFPLLSAGAVF